MKRHLLLPFLLLFPACTHYERSSPELHLSPDLRTIAFFAPTVFASDSPHAVETIDRGGMHFGAFYPLPPLHTGDKLFYLDDRLFTFAVTGRGYADGFILDQGQWHKVDAPFYPVWYPLFTSQYQGQPALFSSAYHTDIYSLKDFTKIGHLDYPVRGIGDGYMLRYTWPEGLTMDLGSFGWMREVSSTPDGGRNLKNPAITAIDLLDPNLKPIMHLDRPPEPADKYSAAPFTDGESQISPDHKMLMIAPLRHGGGGVSAWGPDSIFPWYYTGFAVYEIPTGKLLYARPAFPQYPGPRNPSEIRGTPVSPVTLTSDGVYAIEETIPPDPAATNPALPHRQPTRSDHQFWLTHYTAQGRELVIQLPLSSHNGLIPAFTTAASPAGGFMDICTLEPHPQIIEVPLKPNVTAKDIRYFNLPS